MSFNKDAPIANIEDDKLGFKELAKRISASIISSNIDTTNSFTIAIEGKWGSGKTSLVNLIKEVIKDKAIVMNFNPWIVSDFEQLIEYFFSELMQEIIYASDEAKFKEDFLARDIKSLISFFAPDRVDIGIKGAKVTYKPRERLKNKKTLAKTKENINSYLKKLSKRVVIIIDDIDRLTDKETEALFRLIKAIADFDNIVYILLYDKTIVAKSLEKFKQEKGENYLDKIVQYSITIPKIHHYKIIDILYSELDDLMTQYKDYIDIGRLNSAIPLLKKHITNIRDVKKIVNNMKFEYPQIASEVDFTDFFILTLIKLQKYDLYELIKNREFDRYFEFDYTLDNDEERKLKKKEFLDKLLEPYEDKYTDLFYKIFPSLHDTYYMHEDREIHRYKYIDSNDYFENYFTFSVSEFKLSCSEYLGLYKKLVSDNRKDFENSLLNINKDKVYHFLSILKSIDKIESYEISKNIVINLLVVGLYLRTKLSSYGSYTSINKKILLTSKDKNEIFEAIYKTDEINLIEKIFFYDEIKKDNHSTKIDDKTLDYVRKLLKEEVENIKLNDYLETGKNENSDIDRIYVLISSYKILDIPLENLMNELNELMFSSRENFFKVLNMFVPNSVNSPFDTMKYLITKNTNFKIEEIETYFDSLDKSSFNDKEKEIYEAWKRRNV